MKLARWTLCNCSLSWLQKHTWTKGLTLRSFDDHVKQNEKLVKELKDLSGTHWMPWLQVDPLTSLLGGSLFCGLIDSS